MASQIPIPDDDDALLAQCRVETFRSGGAGGQHRDTTDSAVRLAHEPSGITATAQDERSQHRNKKLALERLREKLWEHNREVVRKSWKKKKRKKNRTHRESARQKRKRVENKRRRGRLKKLRKPPKRKDW